MSDQVRDHVLTIHLEVSVPLRIMQLQERGGPDGADWEKAKEFLDRCMDQPSFSEALLFKVKPGLSSVAFNLLTHAIAVLAFVEGGITIFGRHWDGSQPIFVYRLADKGEGK